MKHDVFVQLLIVKFLTGFRSSERENCSVFEMLQIKIITGLFHGQIENINAGKYATSNTFFILHVDEFKQILCIPG